MPAVAQYWPKPAATPGVDVKCVGCIESHNGLLTPGYPTAISTFTGRFLDSQATQDFQQPFRTSRAFHVYPDLPHNRIYFIIGSAAVVYKADTFFTRLASNEQLAAPVARTQCSLPACAPDRFLSPDWMFYAETGGWGPSRDDGQERLFGLDYDDQGYIYLGNSYFGWGIIDATATPVFHRALDAMGPDEFFPLNIVVLKGSDGRYYALIPNGGNASNVWDVTNRAQPIKRQSVPSQWLPGQRMRMLTASRA